MIEAVELYYFISYIYTYSFCKLELLIPDTVRIDSGRCVDGRCYADVKFVAHPDWKDKARLGPKCEVVTESKSFECKDITVGDRADEIMIKVKGS